MNEQDFLTISELSDITDIRPETLRLYLSRSEFTKYYTRGNIGHNNSKTTIFYLTADFIEKLASFLLLKNKLNSAKKIKHYWEIHLDLQKQPKEITNDEKLDIVYKQYQSLLNRYNEAISLNKKLKIIERICQEPADNMGVLELQNRIKEVLNK